jgi:hypothetical protein
MSEGHMQLLHPWLLLGLVLVPAGVLLHVFRAPGRRHEVSYLGLWQNVLRRVTPEASERLKRFDWLLILEILILVLLVVGLSQPVIWRERPRRHVGFVIDLSASMKTIEADGRSRYEHACAAMDGVLEHLTDDDLVSCVAGPPFEHTAFRLTRADFRRKLAETAPGGTRVVSPRDVPVEPVRLLETGLAALGKEPSVVYLVSDKAPVEAAKDSGGRVRPLALGGPSRNVGIVAFAATPADAGTYELFVRVRNFADRSVARTLVLNKFNAKPQRIGINLEPRATFDKVMIVHPTPAEPVVTVELEGEKDGFAPDDAVGAVLRPLRVVALVHEPSAAYHRLFGGPVFENTFYLETSPDESGVVPREALIIAEGVLPKSLAGTTVIVNPPKGELAGIGIGDVKLLDEASSPVVALDDPLMKSVNLAELKLDRCRPLTLPPTARPLARLGGGVVAASVEHVGGRVIVLSFDGVRAGWPLKPSFVVFWANVLELARKQSGAGGLVHYRTGDVVRLPLGKETAELQTPDGKTTVSPGRDGWGDFRALKVGLHEWTVQGRRQNFAVNLLSEIESDNRPRAAPQSNLNLPIPSSAGSMIPIGPWLCLLGGGLVVAWWHFRR